MWVSSKSASETIIISEYAKCPMCYSSQRQISLARSVNGLLTLRPQYVMAICLNHGYELERGECEKLKGENGGLVEQNAQ